MPTLNKDGSTRKKYTTKKMIMKKNRKSGQKKAWDTRRALYPETNGYKPEQVEVEATKMPMSAPIKKVDVPEEKKVGRVTDELAERINNLDNFLNSIPGVEFNRDEFIHETLTTAVNTILSRVAVVCHGEEELMKQLKGMMEFVEEA